MKILLLTTHLNIGGIGVYTVNLAKYLKAGGIDVTVASSGGDLVADLASNGVPHVVLDIKTKAEFGLKVWKAVPTLNRMVKENGFQLIHAQTRVAQVAACLSEKNTRVPFISTCHGFFRHRRLGRMIFPCWGSKVIAISESVRKHLIGDFNVSPRRTALVYNGIELEQYAHQKDKDRALAVDIGLDEGATVVGTVGRLSSVKGYKYLIRALKEVIAQNEKVQLLFVGEGPEKERLRKEALELGLSMEVFFAPGGRSLGEYFALMDIFCLPSVNEGLGLSLMEAMAAGRACIASNVGGLTELVIHEKDGILVPPEDPDALSDAILYLTRDKDFRRRLAENARKKATGNFSITKSVAGTIEVYKEVIAGG